MATGTAVGPPSIAERMKRTVLDEAPGYRTDPIVVGLLASSTRGDGRARRHRLEMYAEESLAIADHAARGTSHPEAINRRACH